MAYHHPLVGAFLIEDRCIFRTWAPLKKKVEVVINDVAHAMHRDEMGYWSAEVAGVPAGTLYKFRLDDEQMLPDPASVSQPEGVHGYSEVVRRDFQWRDDRWQGLQLKDMIIYELHVGTFTSEGTFEGVISKLPYLKELGVNAIELMPIAQFPGNRNWGYDGVFPFAVHDSYGGVTGLKELVNACHESGIAVILDVVYNHQGPEGNYLGAYGPYFTEKYKTGWGEAINFDDAYSDGVRNFYWQNALTWLDEFHIDGLRLDAVHAIWDSGAKHFIAELASKVKALEETVGRTKILIAEFDLNNPRYISEPTSGGYGLDGQWIDEYHHALHAIITGEVDGYYEDFGTVDHLVKAISDSYVYTGQYSKHRKKKFGDRTQNHYGQFVVFSQNHDQVGNRMLGDRLSASLSFEMLKLTAAAYILSPHVPMLFMGEEYGEKNPFQYFISHTDANLVEAVRKGRREEFSYFQWKGEVPDPYDEQTFLGCKLSWSYESNPQSATLLMFYKFLIALRKGQPALRNVERSSVQLYPAANHTVAFKRYDSSQLLVVALNFGKEEEQLSLGKKTNFKVLLDSSSSRWGGKADEAAEQIFSHDFLTLSPESAKVIQVLD